MAEHGVNGLMAETMEKIRSMVDVNTIIGDPIVTHDGTTLIPISKVVFARVWFGGGGGAGVSIQPVAFLIVSEGNARILPVNMPADSSTDRLIELIPDAINGVQSLFGKRGKKEDAAPETEIAPTEE